MAKLAAKYRADLAIIECVCVDEATHRRRIEARMRGIEGMAEITWARVEQRRTEYEAWTDARLTLDTSAHPAGTVARGSHRLSGMRWSASFL